MILYYKKLNDIYSFKYGALYENEVRICILLQSKLKRLFGRFRLLNRLLRLEPRCATFLDDDRVFLSFQHKVMVVSIAEKRVIKHIPMRSSFSNPLSFCSLKKYGKEEIYWGDYGENVCGDEINIYKYSKDGLEVCYTFPRNSIKHVHNIIFDKWHDRFIVLTGDFGDKVGIYIATRDFKSVEPFLIGDEKYRAVQAVVTEEGLIWATDAVMSDNHLYYCPFGKKEVKKLSQLNGSVIYGLPVNGGLLFSTTVEPYPTGGSLFKALFNNRLAPGIKSRNVDLCFCSVKKELSILKTFKKDWLPISLFQYGQIMFPGYEIDELDEVIINPMSVKKYDGKSITISLN